MRKLKKIIAIVVILVVIFIVLFWTGDDAVPQLKKLTADAVILAFGNSLTYGTGAEEGKNYPSVLARLSGLNVINAGNPGEVSEQGLKRLPALLEQHKPSLLILCHGGNDFLKKKGKKGLINNLKKMIELAQEQGIDVVLIGVPTPGLILSANKLYAEIADEYKLPYEGEILSDVLSDVALKSDQIHPNSKGYKLIAEAVYKLLLNANAIEKRSN